MTSDTRQFLVVIVIQAVIALTTLGCATALTILNKLPSDATVALFGSAIALAGGTAGAATVKRNAAANGPNERPGDGS